uniref:Reverse transcriptase Ty1/copia-type domain-containing protein n=1 Tax=Fagus sylvatica TaxID=28930 RepID=A0A2N9FEK0_FAGSY
MVSKPFMASSNANSLLNRSPLLLLSNMSNLMSIKLDSINYIVWKLQFTTILNAYSMKDHIDGSVTHPNHFLLDEAGSPTLEINPAFKAWKQRDKALLALIYSTLTPSILPMVEVLTLLKKSGKPWNKAIRTRDDSISFKKLSVLLQTKKHSMKENLETNTTMAMYASNIKPQNQFGGKGQGSFVGPNGGRGGRHNQRGRGGRFNNFNTSFFSSQPHQFSQSSSFNAPQQFSPKSDSTRPQCQICRKMGHLAINCYQRMNFAYQGKNPPSKLVAIAATNNPSQIGDMWLTDPEATDHITSNLNNLTTQAPYTGSDQVEVGNSQNLPINTIGNAHIHTKTHKLCLNNVLHVPQIASNLVSIHKLCHDNNCSCYFDSHKFSVQDLPTRKVLYKGLSENGIYPIYSSRFKHLRAAAQQLPSSASHSCNNSYVQTSNNTSTSKSAKDWLLWHHRLGHPSAKILHSVFPNLSKYNPLTKGSALSNSTLSNSALPTSDTSNSALSTSTLPNSDTSNSALSNSNTSNPTLSLLPSIPPIPHPNATIPTQMPLSSSPTYTPDITPGLLDPPLPTSTHSMQTRAKSGIFKPKVCYIAQPDYLHTEPPSYKVAVQFPQWCTAMQEKYDALQRQGTWSLVSSPPSKNIVGCKWVYKLKHNSDGSISRYKAKLVAKGFHQQYGVDYAKTFSPVVKPPTVRLVISLVVSLNWPLRQLDVRNAFLHGSLQEEVYMQQPPGYVQPDHPNLVCKLHKSLYGLKQAPRAWFESFTGQLLHLGFTASSVDNSLFIFHDKHIIAYLLFYMDNIVITSNTPSYLDHLIKSLSSVFELKDLSPLSYFLGLQVHRTSQALYLSQTKYAVDLLHKHHMFDTKPTKTPCSPSTRLTLTEGTPLQEPHSYRSLVGALHYLTFTHPNLSFVVHQVCQFMHSSTTTHLAAAKRILRFADVANTFLGLLQRYLRDTLNHGFLVYLGFNPITWSAKKQPTVSRSSIESEYRALAIATVELCWLRTLLKDLRIYLADTPILLCDNVSALAIASNPVFHAHTKHIEVDFHFV